MRAIMFLQTEMEEGALRQWLNGWLPQEDPEVGRHQNEIIDTMPEHKREFARSTCEFTIRHNQTDSWGIICRPTNNRIEVRLKNEQADKLRSACEAFVEKVNQSDQRIQFDHDEIEVLERDQDIHAFYGKILPDPAERWKLTKREKYQEWCAFHIFLRIAGGCLICTLPIVESRIFSPLMGQIWSKWVCDTLGRLATTFLATSAAAYLSVRFFYFAIARVHYVKWSTGSMRL